MRCSKCGRRLKNASPNGMGPVCARNAIGAKPVRQRRACAADEKQTPLFSEGVA